MTWTYSGNPGYNGKDEVRFLIGDTNPKDQLLQDGEIEYMLGQFNGAAINTAIWCCEAIIAKFSRLADESVGQVKISFSQKAKGYDATLNMLRRRLAVTDVNPFAGGISKSQKQVNAANSDRVRPDFTKHQMENHQDSGGPGSGGPGPDFDDGQL